MFRLLKFAQYFTAVRQSQHEKICGICFVQRSVILQLSAGLAIKDFFHWTERIPEC